MVQRELRSATRHIGYSNPRHCELYKGKAISRRVFIATILTFLLFLTLSSDSLAEEAKYRSSGPFNIRNQMPMYIFFMAPSPDKAETLKKGKMETDVSYHVSNIIMDQHPVWPCQTFPSEGNSLGRREWWLRIDTEVNRVDIKLSYGILDNLELSADIPYFLFSEGYLDGFIQGFEDSFSFITTPTAREIRGSYNYDYRVWNRGKCIISDDSKPNDFGEVSAYLKYKFMDETEWLPTMSLRGGVKFPTTKNNLLGSKKFDYAIGALLDKSFFKRLFLYLNLNYVILERPDILANLDVFKTHMLHGITGIEYFLTNRTSMLFQVTANTTVYDGGVTSTGRDPVVLTIGFNHNFNDKVSWQIAMDENTNTAAPDFGLFTSLKVKI